MSASARHATAGAELESGWSSNHKVKRGLGRCRRCSRGATAVHKHSRTRLGFGVLYKIIAIVTFRHATLDANIAAVLDCAKQQRQQALQPPHARAILGRKVTSQRMGWQARPTRTALVRLHTTRMESSPKVEMQCARWEPQLRVEKGVARNRRGRRSAWPPHSVVKPTRPSG